MDNPTGSQLTLVDTDSPAPLEQDIVLTFDRDDMANTTLRTRGGHISIYSVVTQCGTTTLYAGNVLLATVTRRVFRRDQITFPGCKPMALGTWLKAPMLSALPLVFRAYGRRFEWRRDRSQQLVLCESGRPNQALAWFSQSRLCYGNRAIHAAAHLTIKLEMAEMRDMIVLSCLLAENKLRIIDAISAEQFKFSPYLMVL